MSVELAVLTAELQRNVPVISDVPSVIQIRDCVIRAVDNFSRRVPASRTTTVDVVSGTAEYSMPSNCLRIVSLQKVLDTISGVVHSSSGYLVPVSVSAIESWHQEGLNLVIVPVPVYTWTERVVWYTARHELDGSETYPDMLSAEVETIMKKATASALGLQYNNQAGKSVDYRMSNVSETRSSSVRGLKDRIDQLLKEYEADIEQQTGSAGERADYTVAETNQFLSLFT